MSSSFLRLARLKLLSSPALVAYLAAVLILGVGTWQMLRARDAVLALAEHDARNMAHALAQHATRSIETIDVVLKGAVDQLEAGAFREPGRFQGFLVKRARSIAQVDGMAVLDDRGLRLATSSATAATNASDRTFFAWHRDHRDGDLHLEGQVTEHEGGRVGIPLSRRWNKPDGSFGGVVVAFLSPTYFQRFYDTIAVGAGGSISLIGLSGRYLIRHPFVAGVTEMDISRDPAFIAVLHRSGVGSSHAVSPVDGRERIVGYEHLEGYPLVLVAALARDDTLAPWWREALIEGAVLGSAAVALAALGLALARHRRRMHAAETARRSSEAQLRQKSVLLETTLASMDQGLIVVSPGGTVEVCNPRARALLDLPAALMSSRPSVRTVLEHQLATGEFAGAQALTPALMQDLGFALVPHVYERSRSNGTILEIRSMPLKGGGVVRTYTDVTARRAAEAAQRASEARYRHLAETTSDVITHLSLPDFARTYVSPACRALLGYEPEELLGLRPSAGNMHPEDVEATRIEAGRLARGEVEHTQVTYRARHKRGHWVWIEAGLSLVRDARTEAPAALVCLLRDVTERQRHAEDLREAKQAAEAAAQAKSEFLATMSHEIRTPLNGVIGYADLLLEDRSLSGEQRRHVTRIQGAGAALLTVVNDILDYSRIEAGEIGLDPRAFRLDGLIDGTVSLVRTLADAKHLPLRVAVDASLPAVLVGDEDRLRQVLLNLLNNAVKFTAQGEVTLTIAQAAAEDDACVLRFAVTDTGIGIAEGKRARLFQRFSQVDGSITREFGGTGLGLAISKGLVERMGGTIGAESTVGAGSTFWFTLRLGWGAAAPAQAEAPAPAPFAPRGLHILLVEDVAINRELARIVLERGGYRVDTVEDGAAAVAAVRAQAYDLVLMDVQMPVMDGITATRAIRALAPPAGTLPIIAMTANVLPEQLAKFRAAGMDDHLSKPFKQAALQEVLTRWAGPRSDGGPRAPDVAPSAAVLDPATYGPLRALLGAAKMKELLRDLATHLVERFDEPTLTPGDSPGLAREAHILVSTAGILGFSELSDLCAELEAACVQQREIGALLCAVREARHRALRTIEDLRDAA